MLASTVDFVFESFFFAFLEGRFRKFVELVLQKVLLCGEVFRTFLGRLDLFLNLVPLGPFGGIGRKQFAVACEIVKHLGMRTCVAQQELFALAVHLDKLFA